MALIEKDYDEAIEFPVLRRHVDDGYTVAFKSMTTGLVIKGEYDIVQYSEHWTQANDYDVWEVVEATLKG